MAYEPGDRIGPYEITSRLGAGGMGEVYQALDARLKRAVAIKVLPEEVARDADRLARFEREAHMLASLNHPRIGAIYGIEESGRARCLVLELVEGQTLAARIQGGAVPLPEAIGVALQIAEGLEAAHERGIVHRDLKPANVMLTPEGAVKILDFGLAKALEADPSSGMADASLSPTLTVAATRHGIILGTAAYMSPEQAKGKPVDRRSDIWAFGVILLEMLTGRRIFSGETVSDTLAGVLRAEIEWDSLPRETPPAVRRLLRRCLERDPRQRLRDIGEARIVLAEVVAGRSVEEPVAAPAPARRGWSPAVALALALVAAAAAGLAAWSLKPQAERPLRKFQITAENLGGGPSFALSPDGASVAWAARDGLWVRRLDKLEARRLVELDGITSPFWSPDSQWVGYFAHDKIWKAAVAGGESAVISKNPETVTRGVGASWAEDGTIVFSSGSGPIFEIAARGGDPRVRLAPDEAAGDDHFHEPAWLPGGEGLLFTIHRKEAGTDTIALLAGGTRRTILKLEGQEVWRPVYAPSGHILFRRQPDNEGIWALPFSLSKLEPTGEAFLVAAGATFPSIGSDGTLLCTFSTGSGMQELVRVDRRGEIVEAIGKPQPDIVFPAVSPDGRRVVVESHEGENWDIWVHDIQRATKSRLTFEASIQAEPGWLPDGERIVYSNQGSLEVKAADGTGASRRIGTGQQPGAAPDGKLLVLSRQGPDADTDIWSVPVDGGEPAVVVQTRASEWGASVSPDGRLVAYVSSEAGRPEVFLSRFPTGGGKWQVSVDGGTFPVWSRDGREILYRSEDVLMVVAVEPGPAPVLGAPRRLFDALEKGLALRPRNYGFFPDGKSLVAVRNLEKGPGRDQLTVFLNWDAEFTRQP